MSDVAPTGVPPIDPPRPPVVTPQLPPSKFDDPPPPKLETFGRDYVEELRNENKTWRGKLTAERTAREEAEKAREAASEVAKKAKEDADAGATAAVKAAETRANERVIRSELKAVAVKAGMIDLDGLKLADTTKVKLDEKGEVEGADALIEQLKKDKPYLFGTTGGTTNTTTAPPKPGDAKPFDARTASKDEYNAELRKLGVTIRR